MADLEEEKKIESSKGKVLTAKESNVSKEEKIAKTQEKIKSTKSQEEMWRYEFENQFKQKPNLLSILRELRRTVYENNGIIDGIFGTRGKPELIAYWDTFGLISITQNPNTTTISLTDKGKAFLRFSESI